MPQDVKTRRKYIPEECHIHMTKILVLIDDEFCWHQLQLLCHLEATGV